AVEGQALDERVEPAGRGRGEVVFQEVAAASHPAPAEGAVGLVAGGQGVELLGEDQVAARALGEGVDEVGDGFAGLVGGGGGGEVLLEEGHHMVGVAGERFQQYVVDAGEVVRHRAQRDLGAGGDLAVGDAGDALLGDQVEGGGEDAVAAVGVRVSGGHGRGRAVRGCGPGG